MGRRTTPGTGQLSLEIDAELLAELRAFVAYRWVVERALRRHFDNPPPVVVPDPPLPPLPPPAAAKKRKGTK